MAKYKRKYSSNRKKLVDGGEVSYNGNPVIDQTTQSPYQGYTGNDAGVQNSGVYSTPQTQTQNSSNNGSMWNNPSSYTGMATMGAAGVANEQQLSKNPEASQLDKAQATLKTQQNIQAAVPVWGQVNAAKQGVVNASLPKLDAWNPDASFLAQNIADPAKYIAYASKGIWTGADYRKALKDDANPEVAKAPETPFTKDYQQDAAWQKLNNQTQMKMGGKMCYDNGGNLSEYPESAGSHEESPYGGIPIGQNSLVEGGENASNGVVNSKSYKFNKHLAKGLLMEGIDITKHIGKTPAEAARREDKRYPRKDDIFTKNALAQEEKQGRGKFAIENASAMIGEMSNPSMGMAKYGGRVRYDGGGWINGAWVPETQNQAGPRATNEDDIINATNDLGASSFSGQNLQMTGQTAREASGYNYRTPGQDAMPESIGRSSNTPSIGNSNPSPTINTTSTPSLNSLSGSQNDPNVTNPSGDESPRNRNFDPNSLYNLGNFAGGAYDIYRGLKGGDPVNYDRAKTERINPELVNYQPSRDLQRRDIKEGFRSTQQQLRNVNNPAQYLALMTQTAGTRDKTISDSIAKSYENELNTNSSIRGRANEFNASNQNQANQFNAQVQMQEANARQQEKDIASNTLGYGITQVGEATAGTGRDRQAQMSQSEAEKFIGSTGYKGTRDGKGNILYITNEKGEVIKDFRKK